MATFLRREGRVLLEGPQEVVQALELNMAYGEDRWCYSDTRKFLVSEDRVEARESALPHKRSFIGYSTRGQYRSFQVACLP